MKSLKLHLHADLGLRMGAECLDVVKHAEPFTDGYEPWTPVRGSLLLLPPSAPPLRQARPTGRPAFGTRWPERRQAAYGKAPR